jgi:hypothetical protein
MRSQRRPHPLCVCLPPTGRALDIGEQKRHHPTRVQPRSRHRVGPGYVSISRTAQRSSAGRFANQSNASRASAGSPSAPRSSSVSTRTLVPQTTYAPEPSCLAQLVHGLAHNRNGSLTGTAPGPLPGGPHLGERNQVGNTIPGDACGWRPELAGADTTSSPHGSQRRARRRSAELLCP